jgi:hypothetical protein
MTDYTPTLPDEFAGKGLTVNVKDSRYQGAVAFARENGLTQAAFSNLLAVEARAVLARQGASQPSAPAPAAPKAPEKIEGCDKMSFAQKWVASE